MSFTRHIHSLIHWSHVIHSSNDHMSLTDHMSFTHHIHSLIHWSHVTHPMITCHRLLTCHSLIHVVHSAHVIHWRHVIHCSHAIHCPNDVKWWASDEKHAKKWKKYIKKRANEIEGLWAPKPLIFLRNLHFQAWKKHPKSSTFLPQNLPEHSKEQETIMKTNMKTHRNKMMKNERSCIRCSTENTRFLRKWACS